MADETSPDSKFMDIQAPQTAPQTNSPEEIPPTVEPVMAPAGEEMPEQPTAEAPVDPANTDLDVHGPENPLAPPLGNKSPHHRAPVGVMAAALVVVVVLGGLTFYALKGSGSKPTVANTTTTQSKASTTPVTPTDVDKTSQDVDNALKQTNDAADLNTNDLSDATLGI